MTRKAPDLTIDFTAGSGSAPRTIALLGATLLLASCAVGPDYRRPDAPLAPAYKEAVGMSGWKRAEPSDALPRGAWWQAYGDAELDRLMAKVDISNQSIRAAEAQYRQALALVQSARAALFPTIGASAGDTRSRPSAGIITGVPRAVNENITAGLSASWEIDLWGGIRRSVESNEASALASAADLEAARLSAQATLAQAYFQLRVADLQKRTLDDTVTAYRRSLALTENQYRAGVARQLDVAQAQALLNATVAQAIDVGIGRAQLEHAIAVLVGEPPSVFSIAPEPLSTDPATGMLVASAARLATALPPVPTGLPAQLLERRPDIAGAERRMAAANARIGVAQAAFFPALTLSAAGGYQNGSLPGLLSMPNRFWSLGPALALTIFDAGARSAATDQAVAVYDQTVANYRQTVLTALQDVEDNLVSLRLIDEQTQAQQLAVRYARDAVRIALNQYRAGTVSYLDVVTAQTTALNNERALLTLISRQLTAHVGLIKALGGGWQAGAATAAR